MKKIIVSFILGLVLFSNLLCYGEADKNSFYTYSFADKYKYLRELKEENLEKKEIEALLLPALGDDDIRINLYAVEILFNYDKKNAVNYIMNFLRRGRKNKMIALRVLSYIRRFNSDVLFNEIYQYAIETTDIDIFIETADILLKKIQRNDIRIKILSKLKILLKKVPANMKIKILNILAKNETPVSFFIPYLNDKNQEISNEAFIIVSKLEVEKIKNVLYELKDSENREIAYNAALLLAMGGEKNFLNIIKKDLLAEDPNIRLSALNFLIARIGKINVEDLVIAVKRMKDYDPDEKIKKRAGEFLYYVNLSR